MVASLVGSLPSLPGLNAAPLYFLAQIGRVADFRPSRATVFVLRLALDCLPISLLDAIVAVGVALTCVSLPATR